MCEILLIAVSLLYQYLYCVELIPVNRSASFHITVSGGGAAELAVSVRGPQGELPVRISGDVQSGFNAEFTPTKVGAHSINVEYNGYPVQVSSLSSNDLT